MASSGLLTTEQVGSDPGAPLTLDLKKVRVEVVQGPDRGAQIELGARHVIVGRSPVCDLVLSDTTVSGMHLELALAINGVLVRNLGSRNGVQVGSTAVVEAVVDAATSLVLGRTVLKLEPMLEGTSMPFAAVQRIGGLVGRSLKMKVIFGLIQQCAGTEAPVLIEGATGTGKELAARAIHDLSARAGAPYEIVDCGAIPEHLIEAELFGAAKGADAAAREGRAGVFERAGDGTVVLDEVGALPTALQPKLLALLERGQLRRLGETSTRRVPVRVLATTNRVLAREVRAGRFRPDLYFRLTALRLTIPSLRERKEDIPLLVAELLGTRACPPAWLRELEEHDWPGNVRELRNVLERARAQVETGGPLGSIQHLLDNGPSIDPLDIARRQFERDYLRTLLAKAGHNVRRAAQLAGMTRQGLYGLLARNGIRPQGADPEPDADEV
jgi:transcriptional regulator with PAS, ATPase and Fis domain